jgi:hypothetical protein
MGASFGTTFQAFGIRGVPNAALVDGNGRLVFVGRFKEARQKAVELPKAENPLAPPERNAGQFCAPKPGTCLARIGPPHEWH